MQPALNINVFTAPEKAMVAERVRPFGPPPAFDPSTSTLIFGEHDAVLVDTLMTVAETEALANWVALHHRNLVTIYITHGHFDHFVGLGALLQRFPEARAIATPKSVQLMRKQSELIPFLGKRWPSNFQPRSYSPNPTIRMSSPWKATNCASLNKARPTPSTPPPCTCRLLTSSSAGTSSTTSAICTLATPRRKAGRTGSLRWSVWRLNPTIAIAGHKKTGAPDTPSIIEASKQYLGDFSQLKEATCSDHELYDAMTELYPDRVSHQAWLMFGFGRPNINSTRGGRRVDF